VPGYKIISNHDQDTYRSLNEHEINRLHLSYFTESVQLTFVEHLRVSLEERLHLRVQRWTFNTRKARIYESIGIENTIDTREEFTSLDGFKLANTRG